MADDAIAIAIAETSEVELEAKCKLDGSWHPCHISLCSGGGLSIKFEGQDSEDILVNVEDALACLRVRSVPLQGDNCSSIEEGKHVLAAREKNSQILFFDAVVEKAIRVRHSKRASCRCTFMIKWLFEHAENGISSVPSSSIMMLATESINSHPVVSSYLNSMERSNISTSPSSTTFDDIEGEIDLHGLLKQLEGIGSLTDASKKELIEDTLLGVGQGGRDGRAASEQVSKCAQVICGRGHLRRSRRRQTEPQPAVEDHIPSEPSSTEKSVENQSPLSPLAARAVLASLVSKLPQKIEPVVHGEKKCVSVLDYSTHGTDTVNKVVSSKKRSSPRKAEVTLAESDKKQKGLNSDVQKQKTTVEDLQGNVVTRSQKKLINSKNQPSRFSPRIRSSPRTQSHY